MKIKMLELLLFLSDLNTAEEVLQTDYFNQNQVALIKGSSIIYNGGFNDTPHDRAALSKV